MASTTRELSWGISNPSSSAAEKLTIPVICSVTCMTSISFSVPLFLLCLLARGGCTVSSLTIILIVPLAPSFMGLTALSLTCSLHSSDLLPIAASFLTKIFQVPPLDQLLYFISQLVAIVCVMNISSVKLAVLVSVSIIGSDRRDCGHDIKFFSCIATRTSTMETFSRVMSR